MLAGLRPSLHVWFGLVRFGNFTGTGHGFFPLIVREFLRLVGFGGIRKGIDPGTGVSGENLVLLEGGKLASAARRGIVDFGLYPDAGKGGVFAHLSYYSFLHAEVGGKILLVESPFHLSLCFRLYLSPFPYPFESNLAHRHIGDLNPEGLPSWTFLAV